MYAFSVLAPLLALITCGHAQSFADRCRNFTVTGANITVNTIQFVPNGTNLTFPGVDPSCSLSSQVIYGGDLCRLSLNVSTSNRSGIVLEAWMPSTWNGRFLSAGNGGLGGCISYDDLAYAASYSFAAVGANNGHNGNTGRYFGNNTQVVEDFAYRAVHTGVVLGKNLTQTFYSAPINKSYYLGCSTGGRQGLKSAQMFPNDFDGIVAGAPAFDWNNLQSMSGWQSVIAGFDNKSSTFIPASLWTVINAEIIRQCDGIDGATDGIIEDPDLCRPKFEGLICAANATNTSTCLNPGQYARAVRALEPLYNASGNLIYPRFQPGSQGSMYGLFYSGQPFQYSAEWFQYVVYNNLSFDARNLSQADFTKIARDDVYNISTFNGNLTPFMSRGGKLISYHGLQDNVISSEISPRYYSRLASTMNMTPSALDSFYRLFRISGMSHCRGGPGANDIGQKYVGRPAGVSNRNNNVLEAIVAWVENGQAPDYMEGIKYVNDSGRNAQLFRRRHCRFPYRNVYAGTGNGTDENGWSCRF